ncbi:MAG: hypothetical protein ABI600_03280 [Luteolibacter sp.]
MKFNMIKIGFGLLAGVITTESIHACACGCSVFDVGTSSMLPTGSGMVAYLEYDYQNQNDNRSGTSSAPSSDNDDKKIATQSYTAGLQSMFNRRWGAQIEVPYLLRTFDTDENAASLHWSGLGDIRLRGIYTGFSEDMSSGLTFGVKLPTGGFKHTESLGDIDRDTQIGSGSMDLLLGGFMRGSFSAEPRWKWFTQAQVDAPVITQDHYRPGPEVDAAAGVYYEGLSLGPARISPILQVIGSVRGRDSGSASSHEDTGYERVLVSPGIEVHLAPVKIYLDAELPVYEHVNGNQLVAPVLWKMGVSYMF